MNKKHLKKIPILIYHSISNDESSLSLSIKEFEKHIEINMEKAIDLLKSKFKIYQYSQLPFKKGLLISFSYAYFLNKKHNETTDFTSIPSTIVIITNL